MSSVVREACERLGCPELAGRIRVRRTPDPEVPRVRLPPLGVEYPAIPPMLSYSRPVDGGYEIVIAVNEVARMAEELGMDVLDVERRVVYHETAHILDMAEGVYGFEPVVEPVVAQTTFDDEPVAYMVAMYTHLAKDLVALARLRRAGVLEDVERFPALEARLSEEAFTRSGVLDVPLVFQLSPTLLHVLAYARYAGVEMRGAHFELLSPILDALLEAWRVVDWGGVSRVASLLGFLAATAAYTSLDPVEQCTVIHGLVDTVDVRVSRHVARLCERLSRAVGELLAAGAHGRGGGEGASPRDEDVRG